jgi:hypothetical protein
MLAQECYVRLGHWPSRNSGLNRESASQCRLKRATTVRNALQQLVLARGLESVNERCFGG